ncbi:hypothetical protein N7455_002742 [Penicillium solitum]|uniref:uncharacterized protein n=1 Tax=Penicillium solitum TaxID=60172 RepID=UPI0032C48D17|nr:hypothetical protein N7455_002742 [Penicillium solitum]
MAIYDAAPEARPQGIIRDKVTLASEIIAEQWYGVCKKMEKHDLPKWAIVATEKRKNSCLLDLQK